MLDFLAFLTGALIATLNLGGALYYLWKGDSRNALICFSLFLLLTSELLHALGRLL
jgi:hypothetical protein